MQVVDRVNGMHLKRYHNTAEENPPSDSGTDKQPPLTICSADEEPHQTDPDPSDAGSFPDDSFPDECSTLASANALTPDTDKTTSGKFHNIYYCQCHVMAFSGNIY